jgi:hypothetical protein
VTRHPQREDILAKLEALCEDIADEFDRLRDPTEGYVDGNEMREIRMKVRAMRRGRRVTTMTEARAK